MKWAKLLAGIGVLAMGLALFHGFTRGNLQSEGALIGSIPWGVVSLVDVYVGFFLFAGWIVYREKSIWIALGWVILIMVLGNFIASLYVLIALIRSEESWGKFWMGKNASVEKKKEEG